VKTPFIVCVFVVLVFIIRTVVILCCFVWQSDPNAALCSELKYAINKSFKKYLFEFNKSFLSYRKDKVNLVTSDACVAKLRCILVQDSAVCVVFQMSWWLLREETRVMGLHCGEDCVILSWTVFDWSTRMTDGRTDGQTDGRAMAYSAL